jgi:hypothetical protein
LLYDLKCAGTKSYLAVADEFLARMQPGAAVDRGATQ